MEYSEEFKKNYPLTSEVAELLKRCAKEDVPSDVFLMVAALNSKVLQKESDGQFNSVEKFVLKLFKKR